MVLEVLIIIIAVVTIALIVNGVESYNNKDIMSFREAMDLTNLPIVTFYQGDNKKCR